MPKSEQSRMRMMRMMMTRRMIVNGGSLPGLHCGSISFGLVGRGGWFHVNGRRSPLGLSQGSAADMTRWLTLHACRLGGGGGTALMSMGESLPISRRGSVSLRLGGGGASGPTVIHDV